MLLFFKGRFVTGDFKVGAFLNNRRKDSSSYVKPSDSVIGIFKVSSEMGHVGIFKIIASYISSLVLLLLKIFILCLKNIYYQTKKNAQENIHSKRTIHTQRMSARFLMDTNLASRGLP